jgi:acetylglutamate kinase
VDGALLECSRVSEKLGQVGQVERVNVALLELLLGAGYLPVIAPIGLGPEGERLNLNADTAAGAVARALKAERILFLTDVPGVMKDGAVLKELTDQEADALIANGAATGGMIPKLRSCQEAARSGVPAQILRAGASLLEGLAGREGTLITGGAPC